MPAAIPIAMVGASVAGSLISSNAATSAANTQAQAAQSASQAQLEGERESITAQQNAEGLAQRNITPQLEAGYGALSQLGDLLGIPMAAQGAQSYNLGTGNPVATSPQSVQAQTIAQDFPTWMGGPQGYTQQYASQNPSDLIAGFMKQAPQLLASGKDAAGNPLTQQQITTLQSLLSSGAGAASSGSGAPGALQASTGGLSAAQAGGATLGASGANGALPAGQGVLSDVTIPGFAGSTGTISNPNTLGAQSQQRLMDLLGFNGANPLATLQNTPGYQFELQQGLQGVENSAAANGLQLSGGTLKDLNNYAQGQASQTYQQQLGDAESVYNNSVGNLFQLAGIGGGAANTASGNAISTGQGVGSTLTNTAGQIGSNIIGAGNAQAAGQVGSANAIGSGLGSLGQIYTLNTLFGGGAGSSAPATFGPNTFSMPAGY